MPIAERLGERGAFEKLVEALRRGQEAAVELGVELEEPHWNLVSTMLQQMQLKVTELRNARSYRGIRLLRQ